MKRRSWKQWFAAALIAFYCLPGCNRTQEAPPPQVPEVSVFAVYPQRIVLTTELPGRTSGYLVSEIRPQVNGLLQKRHFTEGSQVKAGQLLYEIDPAPYAAAYENATANLQSTKKAADRAKAALEASSAGIKRYEALLSLAKTNFQRYDKLSKTQAVSAMQLDQAKADVEVADSELRVAQAQVESDRQTLEAAEAAIKQAEAAVKTAKINLDYSKITAPISGRIGRSNVTEGAIVTAYQPIPLAIIQQLDPIFVDVPQSTTELHRLKRNLANGRLKMNGTDEVKIVLEDGTPYPEKGSLKFRDVTVDPTTGSVILRIVVPNPDYTLLPGMFVRAIIDEGVNEQAILIPQQAVSRDPKGNPTTLVVGADGKVQPRGITTDRAIGDKWLVTSGLVPGDRIITEGMQKARPGTTVKIVPQEAAKPAVAKPAGTPSVTPPTKRS